MLTPRAIVAVTSNAAAAETDVLCRRAQRAARLVQGSAYALTGSSASHRRTSWPRSAAVAYRSAFSLLSALRQTASRPGAICGTICRGGVGASWQTLRITSEVFGAMNGGRPVRIS